MNKEELIQMLIGEIEEPLYEVKMPGTEEYLTQDEDGYLYFDENVGAFSDLIDYIKQKFTEQELKAINEVYWILAKEV